MKINFIFCAVAFGGQRSLRAFWPDIRLVSGLTTERFKFGILDIPIKKFISKVTDIITVIYSLAITTKAIDWCLVQLLQFFLLHAASSKELLTDQHDPWTQFLVHEHYINLKTLSGADFLVFHHCVKSLRIRSYSGPHFPAFGLNAERYSPNAGKYGPE